MCFASKQAMTMAEVCGRHNPWARWERTNIVSNLVRCIGTDRVSTRAAPSPTHDLTPTSRPTTDASVHPVVRSPGVHVHPLYARTEFQPFRVCLHVLPIHLHINEDVIASFGRKRAGLKGPDDRAFIRAFIRAMGSPRGIGRG